VRSDWFVTLAVSRRRIRVVDMRSTWIRAWISAAGLIIGAAAIARNRVDWLLAVEEPVMDWLLDGTDTSRWDQAAIISSPGLLIIGTIAMVIIGIIFEWRIALVVVITTLLGTIVTQLLSGIVQRVPPRQDVEIGSFPSLEVVQTGVFWGLIVLMLWWLKLPRLLWQIVIEIGVVLTLIVSVRLILSGVIWPSDAIGSVLVVGLSLITAAIVFEANPAQAPWTRRARNKTEPVAGSPA